MYSMYDTISHTMHALEFITKEFSIPVVLGMVKEVVQYTWITLDVQEVNYP